MSHFSVIVITPPNVEPDSDEFAAVLQPYHEYECTGRDDQYVIDVDVHDEVLETFEESTELRWKDKEGTLHNPYEDRFYRKATPEEKEKNPFDDRVHLKAEDVGMEEVRLPVSNFKTIDEWAKDYGGWERNQEGRFFKHTNPNAHWDWWVIGGRYNGKFEIRKGTVGGKGEGGLMTPVKAEGFDICRRHQLDFDAMKAKNVIDRQKWLDEVIFNTDLVGEEINDAFQAVHSIHKKWMDEPAATRPRGKDYFTWLKLQGHKGMLVHRLKEKNWELPEVPVGWTTQQWVNAAPALTTFAMITLDGQWHEKGSMGWWGIVSDEKDETAWQKFVDETIRDTDGDCWLTVVDCHI